VNEALRLNYARAERATAESARSFYFASRFLPEKKRRAIFALYDYCRHADNLVDARGDRPVAVVRADLARLAEEVRAIHAGGAASGRWLALADTLHRFPVPAEPLLALLGASPWILIRSSSRTASAGATLSAAGVVGLMLGPVSHAEPDRYRPGIGRIAMQLTNICRDVGEDLDRGGISRRGSWSSRTAGGLSSGGDAFSGGSWRSRFRARHRSTRPMWRAAFPTTARVHHLPASAPTLASWLGAQ
jgi:phytoene synthase